MASSELHTDVLDKVDWALFMWDDGYSVAPIKAAGHSERSPFKKMFDEYMLETAGDPVKFMDDRIYIECNGFRFIGGNSFPSMFRSKIMDDEALFDAMLFAKIFKDASKFDASRGRYEEPVWVKATVLNEPNIMLIFQNRIIYHFPDFNVSYWRSDAERWYSIFERKIRSKLDKAFQSKPQWSQYAPSLQSSFEAAATAPPDAVKYPMTEEMKKIVLDELNSFSVDPVMKQKFIFDLKLLTKTSSTGEIDWNVYNPVLM